MAHGSVGSYGKKSSLTPPGIDPDTVRLVAQCLNHYATLGPISEVLTRNPTEPSMSKNSCRSKHNMTSYSCDLHLRRKARCGQRSDAPNPGNYSED
jgi:hypothetical protein